MAKPKNFGRSTTSNTGLTTLFSEPLERRRVLSAAGYLPVGKTPVAGDGTSRVPAQQVIVQLRDALATRGVPAAQALGTVLQLPPFTGFYHS